MSEEFYTSPYAAFLAEAERVKELIQRSALVSGDHRSSLDRFYNWFTSEFTRRFGEATLDEVPDLVPLPNVGQNLVGGNLGSQPLNSSTLPDFSSAFLRPSGQAFVPTSVPSGFGKRKVWLN